MEKDKEKKVEKSWQELAQEESDAKKVEFEKGYKDLIEKTGFEFSPIIIIKATGIIPQLEIILSNRKDIIN